MTEDTIVALSSGGLPCGIAVLRISGSASASVLRALAGPLPPARRASLRRIRKSDGSTIDHGLVLFFDGPNTATGEDLGEIHLHGGRAVVAACLEAATSLPGVRLAEAGEFTRRAFENGRIDLTEAEGLAELLAAETEAQRRQALAQTQGALRRLYEGWMGRLVQARARLEASFDFSDEGDVGPDAGAGVRPVIRRLAGEMGEHLASARQGEILRHGFRVVIAGPPNAGKSSLLNTLADREVAIVSDRAGTTRDLLDVSLDLGGFAVRLTDTAGLREAEDEIEAIGVERARRAIAEADLVIALSDGPRIHVKHDGAVLHVRSKSDLGAGDDPDNDRLALSARTGAGLDALVRAIADAASNAVGDPDAVVPTRTRHRQIVRGAEDILRTLLDRAMPDEILAEELRRAGDLLGLLTGQTGVEDLLDVIFSEFCIGK